MEENPLQKERSLITFYASIFFIISLFASITIYFLDSFVAKFDRKEIIFEKRTESDKKDIFRFNTYGDSDYEKLFQIKRSFIHVWDQYKMKSWGHDAISNTDNFSDYFCYAETLISSADTLFVMNLMKDVHEIELFLNKTNLKPCGTANCASFMGQVVNGLISMYDLTGSQTFYSKVKQITKNLPSSENFALNSFVYNEEEWFPSKNDVFNVHEFSANIIPLISLFKLTNDKNKLDSVMKLIKKLYETSEKHYLFKNLYNLSSNSEIDCEISYECNGYSIYEVLQKANLLTNDSFPLFKNLTSEGTKLILDNFIKIVDDENAFLYHINAKNESIVTLDSYVFTSILLLDENKANKNIKNKTLEKLENGLTKLLSINKNEIPPSYVRLEKNGSLTPVLNRFSFDSRIAETLFVLYRKTHNKKYREIAWKLFLAVNETCRTEYGFSDVYLNIDGEWEKSDGDVDSKVFSEFFKFMFLIFTDSSFLNLDDWIFTPEGHPLRKFNKITL